MKSPFRCEVVALAVALGACGGNATSNIASEGASSGGAGALFGSGGFPNGGAVLGTGGNVDTGRGGSALGSGGRGAPSSCTLGAHHTCNDDPRVSGVWGRCEASGCSCNAGFEVNPNSGKCRSVNADCYSPTQNLDFAYTNGAIGCPCDAATSGDTCRADSSGRLVALTCSMGMRWQAVEDGACGARGATITLERGRCFGGCPVYAVTIAPDGSVSYEGEAYVGVRGAASRKIDPEAVHALADEMESVDYFNMTVPKECATGVAHDAPVITTSLLRYGRMHKISRNLGNDCAPPALSEIEQRIDYIAGTSEWVTCPPDRFCTEP